MNRQILLACALALTAAACSGSNATTTTTTPTVTTYANEFTGTLTQNGGQSYPFAVLSAGSVSASLIALSPDTTTLVGLGLGVWDGTACQAVPGVWSDKATQGTVVSGSVTSPGSLCVRIYDSTGALPQPQNFDLQVQHP
jgi:hypothetical protein